MSATTAAATRSALTLPWIKAATARFVFADPMREAVSLALASGRYLLLTGPGGHGKSEFLTTVLGAIKGLDDPYIKSLGRGTTPEELFGGVNLDAMFRSEGATEQFNTDLSFLRAGAAIFEELFDAPARVLTFLKDTLTAGELRNGAQRVRMLTRLLFAATNHDPQEIAAMGPEVAALVERFPIQLKVEWDDYASGAFLELFQTATTTDQAVETCVSWDDIVELQERTAKVQVGAGVQRMLASVLAELREDKVVISPRTAMMALDLVRAAAAINDRDRAEFGDVIAITYLPGCYSRRNQIATLISELEDSLRAYERIEWLQATYQELSSLAVGDNTLDNLRAIRVRIQQPHDEALALKGDDSLRKVLPRLRDDYKDLARSVDRMIESMETREQQGRSGDLIAEAEVTVRGISERFKRASTFDEAKDLADELAAVIKQIQAIRPSAINRARHADLASGAASLQGRITIKRNGLRSNGWRPSPPSSGATGTSA